MKDKILSIGIVIGLAAVLLCGVLGQDNHMVYDMETTMNSDAGLSGGGMAAAKVSEIVALEVLEANISEAETAEVEENETERFNIYYDSYLVIEFYPDSGSHRQFFDVRPQEADLLLGRVIDIQPERLITYDKGDREFTNYIIKRCIVENPEYNWERIISDISDIGLSYENDVMEDIGEGNFEHLRRVLTVPTGISDGSEQWFYTFGDKDKLLMYSNTMSGGRFLIERCKEEPEEPLPEWNSQESQELLSAVYGEYQVAEFLPTKFFPAWDETFLDGTKTNDSVALLPPEEAGLMIGKTILISEDLFVTYDNYRQPTSYSAKRKENDFWLDKVELESPDYRVKSMRAEEIYGIRDGILTGDLAQQEYVEIDVYPGYQTNREWNLSQMYLADDGRILLYAMGEYFLLEKAGSRENATFFNQENLSGWVGRYHGSSSIRIWVWIGEGYRHGHAEEQSREYEIEIHEDDSGEFYADIKIDAEEWEESVEIRADVCGNEEKISFVLKKYVSGELDFQEKQSDVLLSFRKDASTGDIYTCWGGLNVYKETPEEICFIKE